MKRLSALLLLLCLACKREPPPKPAPPAVKVEAASMAVVRQARVASGPRISGTLQPQESATIIAEVGGTVSSVNVSEGTSVTRGSVLAVIADETAAAAARNAQTAVQSAQTAVAVARRDLDRNSTLAAAGALPRRDIDVARSQLALAETQLAQARTQATQAQERLGNQRVVASTNGTISEKNVSSGDIVTPGAPLFTIVDLGTLQLEASVPTDSLVALQPGAAVDVEVRGYTGERFRGTVSRIAPTVDPGTGQVRVYIVISNEGRRLVGGLFAEGTVTTVARMGLVIPLAALDETGSQPAVTRVRNGVAERVGVQLGVRNETEGVVEIVSGLNEGDRVLTGPARTIAPGTKIAASALSQG
ncbi:MAG TPA: efflux RND transporter periplasmic adaptor subunit [Thermoanaerobaculia bacterium]|jgi:RND family efflux transporter MFP subunit|nr:efflux RND transporter periplasmic adaptor subunit [Thermoanaerobaculia bacterium]